MGSAVVSAVGQADDTGLLSNNLYRLNHILQLALEYCVKYNVQLCPTKKQLLQISPSKKNVTVTYNPIKIDGVPLVFVEQAEHVGVVRSIHGNLPNILLRVSAFKKALSSVVSCGLARGRRSNPTASLRILILYGTPVLMSGLASLVLSSKEVSIVDHSTKELCRTSQSFQ